MKIINTNPKNCSQLFNNRTSKATQKYHHGNNTPKAKFKCKQLVHIKSKRDTKHLPLKKYIHKIPTMKQKNSLLKKACNSAYCCLYLIEELLLQIFNSSYNLVWLSKPTQKYQPKKKKKTIKDKLEFQKIVHKKSKRSSKIYSFFLQVLLERMK